jgi:CRISPR-associated protein Csm3
MKIGGVDLAVVKRDVWVDSKTGKIIFNLNAQNKRKISEPYIPGSSIKGKVRSLLEQYFGLVKAQIHTALHKKLSEDKMKKLGSPVDSDWLEEFDQWEQKAVAKLIILAFGESGSLKKDNKELITTYKEGSGASTDKYEEFVKYPHIELSRFIFRDCFITPDIREKAVKEEVQLTEFKTENAIDRIKGTVNENMGGLRTSERVCSGIRFDFEVSIRTFEKGEREWLEPLLALGLALLQLDTLGGQGSRGYGKISFLIEEKETEKLVKWKVTPQYLKEKEKEIKEAIKRWVGSKGSKNIEG